jgi:ribosome maturation factor RimP
MIEEKGWYPEGDFSMEISSAGIGEPLLLHRQYLKNVGRDLEVVFTDDSIKIGTLMAVTAEDILIQSTEGKGKKAVTQQLLIPFNKIKSTTVQIKF